MGTVRIGKRNTRIKILERAEIGDFSDPFQSDPVKYKLILETWADASYNGNTKKYAMRGVGNTTGDTSFIIRHPGFEIQKDHYVTAKGYKYQVEGTRWADDKLRYLLLDCSFVGNEEDSG